jgi:hypothetical protein
LIEVFATRTQRREEKLGAGCLNSFDKLSTGNADFLAAWAFLTEVLRGSSRTELTDGSLVSWLLEVGKRHSSFFVATVEGEHSFLKRMVL